MAYTRIILLMLLTVFLGSSCFQSTIVGVYSSYPEKNVAFAGQEYTFAKDSSFVYNSFTDNASNHGAFSKKGIGHFKLQGNKLILNYEALIAEESSYIRTVLPCDRKDSIQLDFKIHGELDMEGAFVSLYDMDGLNLGTTTDILGKASLIINKDEIPFNLMMSHISYDSLRISIDQEICAQYDIHIVEAVDVVPAGHQDVFFIKKKRTKLKMRRPDQNKSLTFYKRKNIHQ